MTDPLSRRIWLRGATWLFTGRAAGLVMAALVGVALARSLGPSMFGIYSVITATVSLLATIVTWRLDIHLASTLGPEAEPHQSLISSINAAYLIAVPVVMVMVIVLMAWPLDWALRAAGLVGAAEILLAPMLFHRAVLQVRFQQRGIVLAAVAGRAVWAIVVVAAIAVGLPDLLVWAIAGRLVGTSLEAAMLRRRSGFRTGVRTLLASFDRTGSMRVLNVAWPLAASGFAGVAYNRSDQLLLASLRGAVDTGLYAAGVRLAEILSVLPAVVQSVVLPGAVVAHEQDGISGLSATVRDGLVMTLVPGGLGVAALVRYGEPLAIAVLGTEYEGAGQVLSLLALAELPIFIAAALTTAALALNTRSVIATATVAGLVCNVALNLLAIPALGAVGAALTSLLAYTLVTAINALANPPLRMVARALVSPTVRGLLAIATSVLVTQSFERLLPGLLALAVSYLFVVMLLFGPDLRRVRKSITRGLPT